MSLRHALLGLLAERPASGYDLIKQFETQLSMVWPAQQSQIYGELTRLDEQGWIEVTGTGARNRREYGITDTGREELRNWLTAGDIDLVYRSAALLRVFFLWTLSKEEGAKYLTDFAEHNERRLAVLEAVRDNAEWVGDPVQVCGWLALEFGIRGSRSGKDWGEWAAETLNEHIKPTS
jgi:DNA-binding PadR family transcriptional regulator